MVAWRPEPDLRPPTCGLTLPASPFGLKEPVRSSRPGIRTPTAPSRTHPGGSWRPPSTVNPHEPPTNPLRTPYEPQKSPPGVETSNPRLPDIPPKTLSEALREPWRDAPAQIRLLPSSPVPPFQGSGSSQPTPAHHPGDQPVPSRLQSKKPASARKGIPSGGRLVRFPGVSGEMPILFQAKRRRSLNRQPRPHRPEGEFAGDR